MFSALIIIVAIIGFLISEFVGLYILNELDNNVFRYWWTQALLAVTMIIAVPALLIYLTVLFMGLT